MTLPVQERHIHTEDAQKTIGSVFHPGRASFRCPSHSLRNGRWWQERIVPLQRIGPNSRCRRYEINERFLGSEVEPVLAEECDVIRCQKLLETPSLMNHVSISDPLAQRRGRITSGKPSACRKGLKVVLAFNILKIGICYISISVPIVHGVDGF